MAEQKLSRRERRRLREQLAEQQSASIFNRNEKRESVSAVAAVERAIERVASQESKQPRFTRVSSNSFLTSVESFVRAMDLEPPDTSDPRRLDTWYRAFAHREPFLSGVLNSVIQIDKNRGWKIIGGRNQVARYTKILHECDNGAGWRTFLSWQAQSYYTTRMGFVTEVGTEGDADNAPLRALWSVDPTRVRLTGNTDLPLKYYPRTGGTQDWLPRDFFRAASMVSTSEEQNGYGFPAVARCVDLARIMIAVYQHDNEQLGARAPRGLLLLNGISQTQWDDAMSARSETLDSLERQYFGGVAILASSGAEEVTANLTALSNLPKDWDTKTFTDLLMYGYALAFGYDAREFYPVSGGSLGTATETETQHRKASSKGDLDFSLAFQEKLQARFPATLQFEFEQRDVAGEQSDADLQIKKAQVVTEINKWKVNEQSVLTNAQILQLAADAGVIPGEWTPVEEDITATDTDATAERLMSNTRTRRAIEQFPDEPVVEYNYRTNRTRTLLTRGAVATQKRVWQVEKTTNEQRAANVDRYVAEYDSALTSLYRAAWRGDIDARSMANEHRKLIRGIAASVYYEGLQQGGVEQSEADATDAQNIADWIASQVPNCIDFARAAVEAGNDRSKRDAINARSDLWLRALQDLGTLGYASAQSNTMGTWRLGNTKEHCEDAGDIHGCLQLNGKRHRIKWFTSRGLIPREVGSETLTCGGWQCDCGIFDDKGERLL